MTILEPLEALRNCLKFIDNELNSLLPIECNKDSDFHNLLIKKKQYQEVINKLSSKKDHETIDIKCTLSTFISKRVDEKILIIYNHRLKEFEVTNIRVKGDSNIIEESINHIKNNYEL